jgi:hypothetical protein
VNSGVLQITPLSMEISSVRISTAPHALSLTRQQQPCTRRDAAERSEGAALNSGPDMRDVWRRAAGRPRNCPARLNPARILPGTGRANRLLCNLPPRLVCVPGPDGRGVRG